MSVIFVAGVHGVGKTTTCKKVSEEMGVALYVASQIIKNGKINNADDVSKIVTDLDDNQRILIEGVRYLLKEKRQLILDGHFTLRTKNGVESIPMRVFDLLSISSVVVMTDDPSKIATRIYERDNVEHPVELVRTHQDAEINRARLVAESLRAPLHVLTAFDTKGLRTAVETWM